tara:strand:+ start:64 stop:1317 length:1254 start_codon:yes stop_codon:yes gene_type:complete
MAYEASEIMTAAALQYSTSELKKVKTISGIKKLIVDGKKNIDTNTKFGNAAIKTGFTNLLDPNDPKRLVDMAVGISAALATRKYMGQPSAKITVYMTGNVWPKEVEDFQVSAYGFADYNSADIVITQNKKTFYGISLKKKNKVKAADPTLINKAFDSVFDGKEFEPLKKKLVETRIEYFADLVIEAVKEKIILQKDIDNFKTLSKTKEGKKELFEAKSRDKKQFRKSYIDTKGYANSPKGYDDGNTNDPKSMRYFVNKKLSDKSNNKLWKVFNDLMTADAEKLAESLINIILKVNLFEEIESKKLKGKQFDFALMTGIGDIRGDKVTISEGNITPLKTTLCGLTRIEKKFKGKYKVIQDSEATNKSSAAKIFFKLVRDKFTLMNLEVRYKGSFNPQPQFQGNLSKEFKNLLDNETCG